MRSYLKLCKKSECEIIFFVYIVLIKIKRLKLEGRSLTLPFLLPTKILF